MLWTGLVLLLFAGYHVPQFTAGWWHPRLVSGDDYANVVWLFRQTTLYAVYGAALVALALHARSSAAGARAVACRLNDHIHAIRDRGVRGNPAGRRDRRAPPISLGDA
jgi:succinate dehydrogenase hydrophobic anchor subunit